MQTAPVQARSWVRGCLAGWANAGLAFLYPEWCQLCDRQRATPAQGYVCPVCRSHVRWVEPPWCGRCGRPFQGDLTQPFECTNCLEMEFSFCYARAATLARGEVLEAIHRYKYNRGVWLEPFLADLLCSRAVYDIQTEGWEAIVPVPLHPAKQREREFNQAERLATRLGRAAGLPVYPGLAKRVVPTATQTRLTRKERLRNVREAFVARPAPELKGRRVVLVDDVLTTGATASACARALLRAGAAEVCVWTLARGI